MCAKEVKEKHVETSKVRDIEITKLIKMLKFIQVDHINLEAKKGFNSGRQRCSEIFS